MKMFEWLHFNRNNNSPLIGYRAKGKITSFMLALFRVVLLISVGYIVIYPLLYMVVTSFRSQESYSDPGIVWIPKDIRWQNFIDAFVSMNYLDGLKNTIIIELFSAGMEIISCSVVAYGMSRFKFKAKKYFMVLLILTIVIPPQMIIIPNVMNFANLDFLGILGLLEKAISIDVRPNILDTPLTFYMPSILGVGLRSGNMIFIYMQFFKGLPKELEEAAWIDGAGPIRTFLGIAVPSSGVVFLTVSIFSIVWHWNDYYLAAMYMNENMPLAVSLTLLDSLLGTLGFGSQKVNSLRGSVIMAASLMFILPMLIMYMILQRKFVKSIDRVGITG